MDGSEIDGRDGQSLFKVVSFRVFKGIAAIRVNAQTHTLYSMIRILAKFPPVDIFYEVRVCYLPSPIHTIRSGSRDLIY